ncbi:MAG: hypothetical protein NTU53_18210 [Planctomycetota bacterium]|nr:hypothetical protein [Planctomycetota bacterium]
MVYDHIHGTDDWNYAGYGPRPTRHERWLDFCFVHGRRSTAGRARLVAVGFDRGAFIWDDPNPFWGCVKDVGLTVSRSYRPFQKISTFWFTCDPQKKLQLFAGQPDPVDASRFTIGYEAGDTKGVIDGCLKDDDTIVLKLRP